MEDRIGFSHVNVFPCSYDEEFPLLPNSWMKSKWIFQCLAPALRSHTNPLTSFFNSRSRGGNQSKLPTFVLGCLDVAPLLSHCGEEGRLLLGSSIHASIVKNPEFHLLEDGIARRYALLVWNSLLCMYVRCGRRLRQVRQLFDEIPVRDSVSWNVMLSGSLKDGGFDEGFGVFKRVFEEGVCCFDKATVTTILSGCDRGKLLCVAMMIHGVVFRGGFCRELTVSNSLITAYFKCGGCGLGRQVFEEMVERNVVSWTAVISGLVKNELYEDGLRFLMRMRSGPVEPNRLTYLSAITACSGLCALNDGKQLHDLVWKLGFHSNVCVESALMDMYLKCGCVEDAWKIFELAESLDEVSLTVILVGFSQNGFEEEAINMFVKMVKAGFEVDSTAVSAILGVFGTDTSLNFGQQIHSMTIKKGFDLNTFVCNGLMNMYSKCGDMEKAVKFFDLMPAHIKNSITWNTMIAAYARHGDGHRALKLYEEMRMHDIMPTDVTFLSLIHACSHIGLVEKGVEFVDSMEKCYGMCPRAEHYACVVDMLGRAGLLSEAKSYIEKLPLKPDIQVWQALLGACSISRNSEVGKYAAEQLFLAAPDTPAPYILLANIYSAEGNWKERARTIKRMKEAGVAKETGISWIEIEKEVHSFVVEDRMHPQSESIYWVLAELFVFMAEEGYVPDKRFILYCLNQDVGD